MKREDGAAAGPRPARRRRPSTRRGNGVDHHPPRPGVLAHPGSHQARPRPRTTTWSPSACCPTCSTGPSPWCAARAGSRTGRRRRRQRGGRPGGCFFHKHPCRRFPRTRRPGDDHRVGRARPVPHHHRPGQPHRARPDGRARDPHLGLHVARHRAARHGGVRPRPGPRRGVAGARRRSAAGARGAPLRAPGELRQDHRRQGAARGGAAHPERRLEGSRASSAAGWPRSWSELSPDRFTANMSKAKRQGKIYVDYVRNNRGSTSIAPFSTRAKEQATVAVPLEVVGTRAGASVPTASRSRRWRTGCAGSRTTPGRDTFRRGDAQKLEPAIRQALGVD